MKLLNVSVKSKDTDLGNCNVQEFETVAEAVEFFQAQEVSAAAEQKRDAKDGFGTTRVLDLINSQHRANICNAFRVSKTRGENPITALKAAMKDNPDVKNSLMALLSQYGITGKLD
jgi:hypothetical protein